MTGPASVAVGDFNGDADPDLAVANSSPTTSRCCSAAGHAGGSFGRRPITPPATRPISVAVGDFNADADPDLAVANQGTDDVSVLIGGTGGDFGAATDFAAGVGGFPASVAVGDFNADSDPDLAVANSSTDDVAVLLNSTNDPSNQPPNAVDDAYSHYGSDTPLATTAATGVLANDSRPRRRPADRGARRQPEPRIAGPERGRVVQLPAERGLRRPGLVHLRGERRHRGLQPRDRHDHRRCGL